MEMSDLEELGRAVQEDNGGDADLTTEVRFVLGCGGMLYAVGMRPISSSLLEVLHTSYFTREVYFEME